MRLLLDTNVVIPLEPVEAQGATPNTPLALALANAAAKGGHQLLVHPAIREDVARDKDDARRGAIEMVLARYANLEHPPQSDEVERRLGGTPSTPNDTVDNSLLAATLAEAVQYLVTEDAGIHRKARRLGISDRVLRLADAVVLLRDLHETAPPPPPYVEATKAHCLDRRDPIFESFRADYGRAEFDAWLSKAASTNRDAWLIRSENRYDAILIVKREEGRDVAEFDAQGPVLKLCSFKVAEHASGSKLGELLLKTAFDHARCNRYRWIYVTVFEDHASLVTLLRQFGFARQNKTTSLGELVMLKGLVPPSPSDLASLDHHVVYGPGCVRSYDGQAAYVVPIRPAYHRALFPECEEQQLLSWTGAPKPYGSAIRKAYLCRSQIRRLRPGDNLLFYRSGDLKDVRCLGVVESVLVSTEADRIAGFVGLRTVYRLAEIEEMTAAGEVLAILFRHDRVLTSPLPFAELQSKKVLNAPPQSIVSVGDDGLRSLQECLRVTHDPRANR